MESKKKGKSDTKEVLRQKMEIRVPLKVAKCGSGLHLKLEPKIVKLYTLEPQDIILVQMRFVVYSNVREIPKI